MEKRTLGNSDLEITVLGFGAWAIGGDGWSYGWGPQDDGDSIAAIHEALDGGINWIDTAAIYGLGHSEEVVAKALAQYTGARPYMFTKCARRWHDDGEIYGSLKAESIRFEIESSLRRLKIDTIDLYQIHVPEPEPDIEEAWTMLAAQQEAGKLRYIGVSNFNVDQMKRAQAIAPVTSLQPPYHMLRRGIEAEVLPFCEANNIGVIAYAPMASGLLTGAMTRERIANFAANDWRRNNYCYQEPRLTRNLELVELLRRIGEAHGRTPGEVAIAWTLRHPAVTAAIVGMRKPGQAAGVLGAAELKLSEMEIGEIESFLMA